MDEHNKLRKMFALQQIYRSLYDDYVLRGINESLDPSDIEHTFDRDWKIPHYMLVGADALRVCIGTLIDNMREPPKTILDLPSGSGRVTRHFRSFFPVAKIVACDLYKSHVDFCVSQFDVVGAISKENFDDLEFDTKFDLIFSGSLLTHLPDDLFLSVLRFMSRSLSDQGLAVVTLHGRHVEHIQKHKYQCIEPAVFDIAESTVPTTGFGYVDYNQHFLSTVWTEQARYGVTLSRPHWAIRQLEDDYSIRVLGCIERGWDDAQDVLVFGKPGVNE